MKETDDILKDFFTGHREFEEQNAPQVAPRVVELLEARQLAGRRSKRWSTVAGVVAAVAVMTGLAVHFREVLAAALQQGVLAVDGFLHRCTGALWQTGATVWDGLQDMVHTLATRVVGFQYAYMAGYLLLLGLGIALLLFIDFKVRNSKNIQTI